MPFKNVRQLENSDIGGIENLSEREKRIFLKVFNDEVYKSGVSKSTAIKKAFGAAGKGGSEGHRGPT